MKIVVLASGSGTLLQSVIDTPPEGVTIVAVGADRDCMALERAERAGIETFQIRYTPGETDRNEWNRQLRETLSSYQPDYIVSAGFMRIIGEEVIDAFPGRIINTHPALLPAFPGAHAVEDAVNYGVRVTGSTVHVVDKGVDTGPILAQQAVAVRPGDTPDELHERIKTVERALLVQVLHDIARYGITINGRKAWISQP